MASKAIGFLNFKFSADLSAFERAMKKAQKNLNKFGKNVTKAGQNLSKNLTLPIIALGAASIKSFDQQAKAETKLLTALKGREDVQKRLINQAKELQKVTLFGDEATIESQALLASLGLTEEQIVMLMPQIQNMATALGMDLTAATSLVSKSVSTTTDALARYFDTGLKGVTGQQERAVVLTEALTKKFDAQAEAAAKVGAGPLIMMKNQLGDLGEELGSRLMPFVQKFIDVMVDLMGKFDGLSEKTKDNIVKWGLILAAIGPVLLILGKVAIAIGALMTPVGLITIAIGSLTAAFIYLKTSASDVARSVRNSFRSMTNNVIININSLIAGLNSLGANLDIMPVFALEEAPEKKNNQNSSKSSFFKTLQKLQAQALSSVSLTTGEIGGTGGTEEGLGKTVKQMEALSLATHDTFEEISLLSHRLEGVEMPENLFNTDPIEEYRGSLGDLGEEMATFIGEDIKTLEQITHDAAMKIAKNLAQGAESWEEYGKNIKNVVRETIGAILSQFVMTVALSALKSIPFPFNIIAAGVAAGVARTAFNQMVPEFAEGGLVFGPTTALIGEGVGTTASNPEVVAPLDKLKQYMGGGNQNIIVEGVLKGNDIYLSNRNTSINRLRTT